MEKAIKYKSLVKSLLADLAKRKNQSSRFVKYQLVSDDETGNYVLLRNGWRGESRFYGIVVHIETTNDGKVWLHQDNTDLILADSLLNLGIPEKSIVLGFHAPIMRKDTEFAIN